MSGHGDRMMSVETADGSFDAYLSRPADSSAQYPAVIVLQEIFGVTDFVRRTCDWFASNGFIAAAPDLFWRQQPGVDLGEHERERGMALMQGLDQQQAVADAATLAEALRTLPECSGRVGAVGYCLGGKIAYLLAGRSPIQAAVSYYGVGIHSALDQAASVRAPLLMHIGAEDALCPPAAQDAIVQALYEVPAAEIATYPAGHAFARVGSAAYVEPCAEQANARTLSFLRSHL